MTKYEVYGEGGSEQELPWELRGDPDAATEPPPGTETPWELREDAAAVEDDSGAPWRVVILTDTGAREGGPATQATIGRNDHPTREAALASARETAFTYQPSDPFSPQGRQVYKDRDGFIVVIQGAMTEWVMRVRVVQRLGSA